MRTRRFVLMSALSLIAGSSLRAADPVPASLEAVEREPDLEKRSRAAIAWAQSRVEPILSLYVDGKPEAARAELAKIVEAARISLDSLVATGKNPRKKAKPFKRAEIGTRRLISDLERLRKDLTFDERPDLDEPIAQLEAINLQLLNGIMQKRN